jgi:hypothetical protein
MYMPAERMRVPRKVECPRLAAALTDFSCALQELSFAEAAVCSWQAMQTLHCLHHTPKVFNSNHSKHSISIMRSGLSVVVYSLVSSSFPQSSPPFEHLSFVTYTGVSS